MQDYFRPSFNTYVKLETGFSLVNHSEEPNSWDHLKHRIEPFLIEAGYTSPGGTVNLFAQDLYDLTKKNQAFIAQTNFVIKGQTLGLGMTNYDTYQDPYTLYKTYSNRYTFTTTLGLRPPNASWTLDLGTGVQVQGGHVEGFNKMARLSNRFHDAIMELTVRDRNRNLSFAFRVNILCGGSNTRAQAQTTAEQQQYPWRHENDLRDI